MDNEPKYQYMFRPHFERRFARPFKRCPWRYHLKLEAGAGASSA